MSDLVYFVGRFHVLLVHLPIGILLLAVWLELLGRRPRFAALAPAVDLTWLAGALTALLALGVGYLHATEPGFSGSALDVHRWSATALTAFAFGVWACRSEAPQVYARGWVAAVTGTPLLLLLAGHSGSHLTHGSTYLAEYAPGPLRSWAVPEELRPRAPVTALAQADVFLDVVGPALRRRCGDCHNESRRRGELSLITYDALLEGGENGPVIVRRDPDASDLFRRIRLPADDVDFMPQEEKPPLSADEAVALRWWVAEGAPRRGTVAALAPPEPIAAAIARSLGLPPGEASAVASRR